MSEKKSLKQAEPLVVVTTIAGFSDKERGIRRQIVPIRVLRQSGQVHRIEKIRHWHEEPVGHGHRHVHITVQTEDMRMLDIVFNTHEICWYLVHEEASMMLE